MKRFSGILLPFCLLLFVTACSTGQVFPDEPSIEFVSISEGPVQQLTEEFTITIHFQDGDGDLGDDNEEVNNLFVRHTIPGLDTVPYDFKIPNLTPDTKNPSIQGDINIQVAAPPLSSILPGNPDIDEEYAVFRVWLMDRAGNVSNEILTDPILITK